jgi:hypothetical protein
MLWRRQGSTFLGLLLAASVSLGASGCGFSQAKARQRETSTLRPLFMIYAMAGKNAASEEAFKKYVASLPQEELTKWGAADRESLFISNRDHKPYVILYGDAAKSGPPGPAGFPVIAYEQEGVGGKRYVASSMAIEEVDDARFHALVPSAH